MYKARKRISPTLKTGATEMNKLNTFLYLCLMSFAAVAPAYAAPTQAATMPTEKSLYQRIGGYDALAAVTDEFIHHLATDPQLGRFFQGLNDDSKTRVRQHVIDFLCVATGGPCKYTGRDMRTARTGLNISGPDWNKSVEYLVETLDKFKVPEKEKSQVLGAISGLKADIVGR
jgi:hemoglobin